MLPALQLIIDAFGWRAACLVTAAAIVLIVIPLNIAFQRKAPQDLGLEPDGDRSAADEAAAPEGTRRFVHDNVVDRAWAEREWTLSLALRTARFWWLCVAYFCGLFVWYALQVHQTRFLIEAGFGTGEAAAALGFVALSGVAGQIAIGAFSDWAGREIAWSLCGLGFAVAAVCFLLIADDPSNVALVGAVVMQGLFGYGMASIYGAIPAELFAGRRFASIFAIATLGGNFGAAAGAWTLGVVHDNTGSYQFGFMLCVVLALVSVAAIWLAAPRRVRLVAGRARARTAQLLPMSPTP